MKLPVPSASAKKITKVTYYALNLNLNIVDSLKIINSTIKRKEAQWSLYKSPDDHL